METAAQPRTESDPIAASQASEDAATSRDLMAGDVVSIWASPPMVVEAFSGENARVVWFNDGDGDVCHAVLPTRLLQLSSAHPAESAP